MSNLHSMLSRRPRQSKNLDFSFRTRVSDGTGFFPLKRPCKKKQHHHLTRSNSVDKLDTVSRRTCGCDLVFQTVPLRSTMRAHSAGHRCCAINNWSSEHRDWPTRLVRCLTPLSNQRRCQPRGKGEPPLDESFAGLSCERWFMHQCATPFAVRSPTTAAFRPSPGLAPASCT